MLLLDAPERAVSIIERRRGHLQLHLLFAAFCFQVLGEFSCWRLLFKILNSISRLQFPRIQFLESNFGSQSLTSATNSMLFELIRSSSSLIGRNQHNSLNGLKCPSESKVRVRFSKTLLQKSLCVQYSWRPT